MLFVSSAAPKNNLKQNPESPHADGESHDPNNNKKKRESQAFIIKNI